MACQIRDLEDRITSRAIQQALANLPKDLNETYDRMLARIHDDGRPDAIRMLQFLTYSWRPLALNELVDLVAVNRTESPAFDPCNRIKDPTRLVRLCSSLIKSSSDGPRTELSLAHYTVQEFLVSVSIYKADFSPEAAHASLATVCMSYLRSIDHQQNLDHDRTICPDALFPFYRYSAPMWKHHAIAAEKLVLQEILDVLFDPRGTFHYPHTSNRIEKIPPIWFACNLGFSVQCLAAICNDTRSQRTDINHYVEKQKGDPYWGDPLSVALRKWRMDHVHFLLDKNVMPKLFHLHVLYVRTSDTGPEGQLRKLEIAEVLLDNLSEDQAYASKNLDLDTFKSVPDHGMRTFNEHAAYTHEILVDLCMQREPKVVRRFLATFPELSKYALLRMYRPRCRPLERAKLFEHLEIAACLETFISEHARDSDDLPNSQNGSSRVYKRKRDSLSK